MCHSVLHPGFGRTSVYLGASSLLNLAVQQDFFILFSVSLWNDLADSVFDGVGLTGFKSWFMLFICLSSSLTFCLHLFSPFSSFFLWVGILGLESLFELIVCKLLSSSRTLPTCFNINNNNDDNNNFISRVGKQQYNIIDMTR